MKYKILFWGLLISLVSSSKYGAAQDFNFPPLQGFKIVTNYPVYLPENLWDFIDGAADTYLSYNFIDLHVAEYKKGREVIKLEIYRHSDHTMAFGIYSSERSPSFNFINLGSQGYITDGSINFFKGNYYVKIKTYSKKEKIIQAARALSESVEGMLQGDNGMPAMLAMFPPEGRLPNEETFVNESVLGHSFLSHAFKAPYQIGPDKFSIYIIQDKTPEAATKTLNTYVASTGIDPVENGDGKYILKDGYNGTIFLAGKNEMIVIISGLAADQAEIAGKYTSEILR
jgi:hypothetical protein